MKRRELERHLRGYGCRFYEHGAKHDGWINPLTGAKTTIPRHANINRFTAKTICRILSVPLPSSL